MVNRRRWLHAIVVLAATWLLVPSLAHGQLHTVELFISDQEGNCDCAQVLASLGRITGVESVRRRADQRFAIIQMRPENAVRFQQIRDVLKNSGIRAHEARVTAVGSLRHSDTGQLQFVIARSGEIFDLEPTQAAQDVCTDILLGSEVLVNGMIPALRGRGPAVMRFDSLVEAGSD